LLPARAILAFNPSPFAPALYLLAGAAAVFVGSLIPAALLRLVVRTYFRVRLPFPLAIQAVAVVIAIILGAVLIATRWLGLSGLWFAFYPGVIAVGLALIFGPVVFGTMIESRDGAPIGLRRGAAAAFLVTLICAGAAALVAMLGRFF
jgi:hypothetical protein